MRLDMYLTKKAQVDLLKDADCNELLDFQNGELKKYTPEEGDLTIDINFPSAYWR